jgi:hypothetical protein
MFIDEVVVQHHLHHVHLSCLFHQHLVLAKYDD